MAFLKKYFLFLTLLPLLLMASSASYYRFVSANDYLVSFADDCDPEQGYCYESEGYYFSIIEHHAATLHNTCGPDVTECDDAYYCEEGDSGCFIYECDPEYDGVDACHTLIE